MRRKLNYDLQFFADSTSDDDVSTSDGDAGEGDNNTDNRGDGGIDPEAFAAIIAEKDKKLEELEEEMKKVRKSNAELLLKISADRKQDVPLEKTIIDFCDTRKPVNRQ